MRLIDADAFRIKLASIAKNCARSDAQRALMGRCAYALEKTTTVGGWISVKDRMPEKSGEYLCWFGANKVAIGPAIVTYVDEWKAFGRLQSLEKYPNITHWMPLPEPPEEDEK